MATIEVGTKYQVAMGENVTFVDTRAGFLVLAPSSAATPSLSIAGTVRSVTGPTFLGETIGIFVSQAVNASAPAIVIEASGLLHVEGRDAFALWGYGYQGPNVVNDGRLEVVGDADAWAIKQSFGFDNHGAVEVTSRNISIGVEIKFAFSNSGTINVFGETIATGVDADQIPLDFPFSNTGRIVAHDNSAAYVSVGVLWRGNAPFTNDGWIEGDAALRAPRPSSFDPLTPNSFTNNGVLVGKVDLSERFARFANNGEIRGDVILGAGGDTYSGATGSASGMVSGGAGDDSLQGGAGFDNFQGNTGADTEFGGGGSDWVVGGKDNDSLSGGADYDLVYGNIGNDTCDGGDGNDIVRGGQDNDLCFGGAGDDFISGDKGDDTLTGGAGADVFHAFGDAGLDRVTDFRLSEGDRVQLDPGTQYTVAQIGADTVISMTGGAQMVLVGVQMSGLPTGWIFVS